MRPFIHRAGGHHHDASVLGTAVLLSRGGHQLVCAVNGRDDDQRVGCRNRTRDQGPFEGDVRVNGSDRVFSAGRAELDLERNALMLEDQVVIQDEVLCVEGERAEGQLLSGEGLIQRAAFRQRSGLQGQVETLQLYSDGAISLTNGAVTFCPSLRHPGRLALNRLQPIPSSPLWCEAFNAAP